MYSVALEDLPTDTSSDNAPVAIAPPEEQKRIISDIQRNDSRLKVGDDWYCVLTKWWIAWKEYVGLMQYSYGPRTHTPHPGPIDNSPLVNEKGVLLPNVSENSDFVYVNKQVWDLLCSWYGGGPAIFHKVISRTRGHPPLVIETRPLTLSVIYSSEPTESYKIELSRADTVGTLKEHLCKHKNLIPADVRVWDYHENRKLKVLTEPSDRLDDAQIFDHQLILVEMKKPDGTWPDDDRRSSSSSDYYGGYNYNSSRRPTKPGLTGLNNLGNTCFMNSSLQCLSNTVPLSEFFISDSYLRDINKDNPLGMQGKLAEEFARLVRELWSGQSSAVVPRDFKTKLETFATQFSGYQQHDSQELLAFLLDGLHEDLNRVKKKPYVEMKEADGRADEDVAAEAWNLHKSRNNSIVVDWFQGQLKSTLVCPDCDRVSVTFDPFMYLSLPLPMKMHRTIKVTFFQLSGAKLPIKYGVKVNKFGTIADLKAALSAMCGVPAEGLVITEVYNYRFFKKFNDGESIDCINEKDFIHAYEIYVPTPQENEWDTIYCPVYHLKEGGGYTYTARKSLFGMPLIISVPPKATYEMLHQIILQRVQRYLKVPITQPRELSSEPQAEPATQPDDMMSLDVVEPVPPQNNENDSSGYASDSEGDDADSDDGDEPLARNKVHTHRFSEDTAMPQSSGGIALDPSKFFEIMVVDSYGNNEKRLENDGRPLDLEDRQYLAISWNPTLFNMVYDSDLEKETTEHPSASDENDEENSEVSLDRCLELFTATERLGPEDPWYCSKCKDFRQATKKFDLWKVPPILVIHLKRFSYRNKYWREKLETHVNYPVRGLDLSRHLISKPTVPPVYDLYAVSNHYGSMGGGHYTAYALNKHTNKWYKFDDSYVSEVEESQVVASSGYVLFYRRRDTSSDPVYNSITPNSNDNNNHDHNNNNDNSSNNIHNNGNSTTTTTNGNNTTTTTNGNISNNHENYYGSNGNNSNNVNNNHGSSSSRRTLASTIQLIEEDTDDDDDVLDDVLDISSGVSGDFERPRGQSS